MALLKPSQIARQYGVTPSTVGSWILSGELEAMDFAPSNSEVKRWRVTEEAMKEFMEKRTLGKKRNLPPFTRYV